MTDTAGRIHDIARALEKGQRREALTQMQFLHAMACLDALAAELEAERQVAETAMDAHEKACERAEAAEKERDENEAAFKIWRRRSGWEIRID